MGTLKVESCRFKGSTQDKTAPLTQVTGMKIFMQAERTSKEDVVGVFIGGPGDRGKEEIRATGEDVSCSGCEWVTAVVVPTTPTGGQPFKLTRTCIRKGKCGSDNPGHTVGEKDGQGEASTTALLGPDWG
jgi:hypothetical protein